MMIILNIILGYVFSIAITCFINAANSTRIPNNAWDLIKLTFMPYVLINLKSIRHDNI